MKNSEVPTVKRSVSKKKDNWWKSQEGKVRNRNLISIGEYPHFRPKLLEEIRQMDDGKLKDEKYGHLRGLGEKCYWAVFDNDTDSPEDFVLFPVTTMYEEVGCNELLARVLGCTVHHVVVHCSYSLMVSDYKLNRLDIALKGCFTMISAHGIKELAAEISQGPPACNKHQQFMSELKGYQAQQDTIKHSVNELKELIDNLSAK